MIGCAEDKAELEIKSGIVKVQAERVHNAAAPGKRSLPPTRSVGESAAEPLTGAATLVRAHVLFLSVMVLHGFVYSNRIVNKIV
jgi:hypothetical protein